LPVDRLRDALRFVPNVAVLDRAASPGGRPPLFAELAAVLEETDVRLRSFVYGLGGREFHPEDVSEVYDELLSPQRAPAYVGLRGATCPV
jgi:pyruvate/2-oxoacid:ferredoxin oxidoreductase alpha subunit